MNLDTIIFGNYTLGQLLLPLVFTTCGAIALCLPYWKPKKAKETYQATIISKRTEYSNTPQIHYQGNRWNYLITFQCENGETLKLHTNETTYKELTEGMTGELTYQNDTLITFEYDDFC